MNKLKKAWAFLISKKQYWLAAVLIAVLFLGAAFAMGKGSSFVEYVYSLF